MQKSTNIPADLQRLKERFKHWRQTRTGKVITPPELLSEAVSLSKKYGITYVSNQLSLNHVILKVQGLEQAPELQTHFIEVQRAAKPAGVRRLHDAQVHIQCAQDKNLKIFLESPGPGEWGSLIAGFFEASQNINAQAVA